MKIIIILLLLFVYIYCCDDQIKSLNGNNGGRIVIEIESEEDDDIDDRFYILNTMVSYTNWPTCESNVTELKLQLVCIGSHKKIVTSDFEEQFQREGGEDINCDKEDMVKFRFLKNFGKTYIGCAATNETVFMYTVIDLNQIDTRLNPLVVFLIALSVIVFIAITVAVIFYYYKRRKQTEKNKELLEDKVNNM